MSLAKFFFSLVKMLTRCSSYSRITSKSSKHNASINTLCFVAPDLSQTDAIEMFQKQNNSLNNIENCALVGEIPLLKATDLDVEGNKSFSPNYFIQSW